MKMDFERVEEIMRVLETDIAEFKGYLSGVSDAVNDVAGKSWGGKVANSFQRGFSAMYEKLNNTSENLSLAYDAIKRNAIDSGNIIDEEATGVDHFFDNFL